MSSIVVEVLGLWREAERRAAACPPGSADARDLALLVSELRQAYQALGSPGSAVEAEQRIQLALDRGRARLAPWSADGGPSRPPSSPAGRRRRPA